MGGPRDGVHTAEYSEGRGGVLGDPRAGALRYGNFHALRRGTDCEGWGLV